MDARQIRHRRDAVGRVGTPPQRPAPSPQRARRPAGEETRQGRAVPRFETAHTADLPAATLAAARGLLVLVFGDELEEHDWEHALGGVHALAWEGEVLIGHASVVQRRLLHGDRALRTGYVEGVAVHPGHRRRGHGTALMRALERVIRGAYDLGALGTTDEAAPLYARLGWQRWEGPTSALTPQGVRRTPGEDGGVLVLPVTVALDLAGGLTCDWRDGDVW
jgi:aminoglycoside 2'-N-acetyltransferase I